MENNNSSVWTLARIWNEALDSKLERVAEPRDRMWASELSKSDLDIFLKIKGVEPSNAPNARAKRKFEAGNIWEFIIRLILIRAGIFKEAQTRVEKKIDESSLLVTGKIDFLAGGSVSSSAKDEIHSLALPDIFERAGQNIIDYFTTHYPNGFDEKIIEVKSVSSFGYDKVERTNKAINGHDLQAFHYAQGLQKEAVIVYISRDDARMYEIPILPNDQKLKARYEEKIRRVSEFVNNDVYPEKEPVFVFDEAVGKFSKNFNVQYSSFLKMNYGIDNEGAYDEIYGSKIERFNRVVGRLAQGKEMTKNNLEAVKEMEECGFVFEDIKKVVEKLASKKK